MANCAIYVVPRVQQGNNFDANGAYSFDLAYETSDANKSFGVTTTSPVDWASSAQQIDNAIMDAVIAAASSDFNVTLTRADCQVFR